LQYLSGDISKPLELTLLPKMNIERKYKAKSLYPHNLRRQALYFDQQTYLRSLLYRNDRATMGLQ
jgi:asparagine synthase (glutamine-hydrolysing)